MAQLGDTIIQGSARVTDTLYGALKSTTVTLNKDDWTSPAPYTQTINTIAGLTNDAVIFISPVITGSSENYQMIANAMIDCMYDTSNNKLKFYAFGQKPSDHITVNIAWGY